MRIITVFSHQFFLKNKCVIYHHTIQRTFLLRFQQRFQSLRFLIQFLYFQLSQFLFYQLAQLGLYLFQKNKYVIYHHIILHTFLLQFQLQIQFQQFLLVSFFRLFQLLLISYFQFINFLSLIQLFQQQFSYQLVKPQQAFKQLLLVIIQVPQVNKHLR